MAALRPYKEIQAALSMMRGPKHNSVGWSVIWNLAIAQLRLGRSVVIDAVATEEQATRTRALAAEEAAGCVVVLATCSDERIHRSRLEGRTRNIPGWHELDWAHVLDVKRRFSPPATVDLVLDAVNPLVHNHAALGELLQSDHS
jgi:predicted kinase